jgi:N-acetylmuramoyl-L-alanine amidase
MLLRLSRAAAVLAILPAGGVAQSGLIQVTGLRQWSHPTATRVVLQTTGPFEFRSDRAVNPERLFFDILNSRPLIEGRRIASLQLNDPLVKRVRVAETAPGTTRVVFDLNTSVDFTVSRLEAPYRMVIELRPVVITRSGRHRVFVPPPQSPVYLPAVQLAAAGPAIDLTPFQTVLLPSPVFPRIVLRPAATPAIAAPPIVTPATPALSTKVIPATRPPTAELSPKVSENATRSMTRALGLKVNRIVIDAGHGGHDEGTSGPNGVLEKEVVLDVALRLSRLVQSRMGADVVLTRSDDTFIPLHERTAIANAQKADLFLSIHANSSPAREVAGTETFFLNFTNNPAAMAVAARENAGSEKSVGDLKDLVQQITLNDKIAESETFAQTIESSIAAAAGRSNPAAKDRGVKRAPFVVLIGAGMPSVLAEIGFLTNSRDESNLGKGEYRQKVAEALYKGLSQYAQSLSHFETTASKTTAKVTGKPAGAGN